MNSEMPSTQRVRAFILIGAAIVVAVLGVLLILGAPALADSACRDWGSDRGYTEVQFSAGKKTDNCQGLDSGGAVIYTTAQAPAWVTVAALAAFAAAVVLFVLAAKAGALRAIAPTPQTKA